MCCTWKFPLTRNIFLFFFFQNLIFRYLQTRARVDIWLYENINMHMEGSIVGFDEYMNIVLDDAEEVYVKTQTRKQIGRFSYQFVFESFLRTEAIRLKKNHFKLLMLINVLSLFFVIRPSPIERR